MATGLPSATDVRVVFTDVDGTLLDSNHELPASAPYVARELRRRGVLLVTATGKTRSCLAPVLRQLHPHVDPLRLPGVYVNGCSAFAADGQGLPEGGLSPDAVAAACAAAAAQGREVLAFCGGDVIRAPLPQGALAVDLGKYGEAVPQLCTDLPGLARGGTTVHKLLVLCGEDTAAERSSYEAELGRVGGAAARGCEVTNAVPHQLEVVPVGVDKGTAVLQVLRSMGLGPENALAFGDGSNDVPMFAALGRGRSVAMRNAGPAARAAAGFVTPGDNDSEGLCRAIARIFSIPLPPPPRL
eukprot:TRINITY_DN13609_c0_g6_i1.p1 TRINITY_DN13609_c0_g6~~TRINITY_DN13609_c0_g6_i1.p1  ORF type:complete len:299 (+),score=67.61 TRINITY_DN13609_c0_g6_i1:72-968(+)